MDMAAEYSPARYDTQMRRGWGALLGLLPFITRRAGEYSPAGRVGVQSWGVLPGWMRGANQDVHGLRMKHACIHTH